MVKKKIIRLKKKVKKIKFRFVIFGLKKFKQTTKIQIRVFPINNI